MTTQSKVVEIACTLRQLDDAQSRRGFVIVPPPVEPPPEPETEDAAPPPESLVEEDLARMADDATAALEAGLAMFARFKNQGVNERGVAAFHRRTRVAVKAVEDYWQTLARDAPPLLNQAEQRRTGWSTGQVSTRCSPSHP